MKQKRCILLFLLICTKLYAQLDEPILSDTMTLSQAKYELQREMATINYYFFQDYYGQYLGDRFKYHKTFRDKIEEFELLPQDTIRKRIEKRNWRTSLNQTNRGKESELRINHSFDGNRINKARSSTPRYMKSSFIPRKIFYYGSMESNPEVLKTDNWYKNRKHIDSMLIDLTIHYPTALNTVSVSATTAEKKDFGNGSFLRLLSNDGNFADVSVTDDIVDNLASIHGITEDGVRFDHSMNTYTPKQPSSEMFNYASTCYMYCQQLVQSIDGGKYHSVEDLIKEFNETRPTAPAIKWIYRYAFKNRNNIQSIEFKYYTSYDSITLKNVMAYDPIPRKGDYVIVEESTGHGIIRGIADKDGKWIMQPNAGTVIINEVAGIFYKIGATVDHTKKSYKLVYVNEKGKRFVEPDFELKENIDNTILIVEKDELQGAVHCNGKTLLPVTFSSVNYQKSWGMFIVRLNVDVPQYQLYFADGRQALPKNYRLIEIAGDKLYTTEIENDTEIVEDYDMNFFLVNNTD